MYDVRVTSLSYLDTPYIRDSIRNSVTALLVNMPFVIVGDNAKKGIMLRHLYSALRCCKFASRPFAFVRESSCCLFLKSIICSNHFIGLVYWFDSLSYGPRRRGLTEGIKPGTIPVFHKL